MEQLYKDGTDIFQILNAIERRAGLFILKQNLDYLYNFISGYKFFANVTQTEIKNLDRLDQFSLFLKREFNEEFENTMGWFGQLHSRFGSEEGFLKFFEYLHKFKTENHY